MSAPAFHPETPPPGFEKRLVNMWRDRPKITPRLQLVHTNGASREGSVEASLAWANAGGGNTIPHYQIDRSGRGAMLLPLDRKGIANYKAADFSIGIETADLGYVADPYPAGSFFTERQAESVATALAYSALGYGIPLEYPARWDGNGSACHTEPFAYPYWTNAAGKACPGDRKKRQMRDVVLPLAQQILAAWHGPPSKEIDKVLFVVRDRSNNHVWTSNGVWRYELPSQAAFDALAFVAAAQGSPLPALVDVDHEQLPGFGVALSQ